MTAGRSARVAPDTAHILLWTWEPAGRFLG